jgi:serine/threonine protein kinase/tetratricopeptide (TPR) repeat protein
MITHHVQAWLPGLVLAGKYELIEKIGAGGMGAVHAARRLSLGDIVAIKSILPDRTNARNRARFLREARAVARIRHSNVVQVFDFGEAEDGRPYMVMEFVDGPTLARVLAETGGIAIAQALSLFADVCEAIEAGHRRGVVHRDIKPGNVMLDRSDDGAEIVKVLDFGLASMTDDAQEQSRPNALVGTVAYMSPESIEHGAVSPASDVFSLGVMLYEMITGEVPFRGANAVGTIMAVCEGVYVPPGERIEGLPDAVGNAIAAALSRSPTDRPGSALELANLALGRGATLPTAVGIHLGRRSFENSSARSQSLSGLTGHGDQPTGLVDLSASSSQQITPTGEGMSLLGATRLRADEDTADGEPGGPPEPESSSPSPPAEAEDEHDTQRVRAAMTSTSFVGRRLELDTLLELLAASARDEIPIAVVLGEPGMGRTRLLRRFGELARERGAAVFEGRFWGYDGDRVAAGETFLRMLDLGPEQANAGIDRRSAFADLAARFEAAADGRALVLLLDDLHHAPSRDLEFLTYLVRGGQRAVPILVVASARSTTARSDAATELSRWLLQLAGLKARTTLTLGRLTEDELRAWLETAFGRLRIHPRDLRRLERTSAGNPYFLSELIRHLVAGGRLHRVEGEQTWACEPLSGDVLPEGVASAVADQLASLAPELRTLLETAAVIGEHLHADVLAHAAGLEDDALDELLDEAVALDLLVEQELESGADLRFRNTTVQQVLYDRLGNRKRRKLHAAVVEALVELGHAGSGSGARSAQLLAWHYRAIADWRRAIGFGLHAAREALGRHDHDAAEHSLEHVAAALSELRSGRGPGRSAGPALDPTAEASIELLMLALGGSLDARVGRYAEGAARLREAQIQLERDGDRLASGRAILSTWLQNGEDIDRPLAYLRFEVALSLARCHVGLGALEAASTIGHEALSRALALTPEHSGGELPRLEAEWEARVALGHALGRFGRWNDAIDVLAPIIDVDPRPQLRVLHVMALRERGWLAARKGAIADAQRYTEQTRVEAAACREPLADYCVASISAVTHAAQGDWRSASREYRQALRLARALSLRRREMIEQANLALALAELADHDEALQNMLSVRAICRELGDVASAADSRVGLGKILRGRGNLDEAIDSFRRGHEACAAVGRHEYAAIALFELGRCELQREHWAAAHEVLLLARDRFAQMGSLHEWEVELALAKTMRRLGDEPAALDHAKAAHALLEARRRLLEPGADASSSQRVDRGMAEVASFVEERL